MSGYDGYSMSNNARNAYAQGELPASKMAAEARRRGFTGCTTADIRTAWTRSSYHHTSKKYNSTDFYDTADFDDEEYVEALREAIRERKRALLPVARYECPECGAEHDMPGRCNVCEEVAYQEAGFTMSDCSATGCRMRVRHHITELSGCINHKGEVRP